MLTRGSGKGRKTGRRPGEPVYEPKHPARCSIIETVCSALGINEARLREATGLNRSVVRHHLRFLLDAGVLRKVPVGRENHYFPAGSSPKRMEQVAAASHGRAKEVLRHIYRDPGIAQAELAVAASMTRKVLRNYLDLLSEHGLVDERRDSRILRYWPGDSVDEAVFERVVSNPGAWWPEGLDPRTDPLEPDARRFMR